MLVPAAAALLTAGAACVAYGVLVERRWYRLRTVPVPGRLRGDGPTLRILHLSDLHLGASNGHRSAFIESLADADHDLVVVTGDLLGAAGAERIAIEALAPLTGPGRPGVVVLGSNDFQGPVPRSPVHYFLDRRRAAHRSQDPDDPPRRHGVMLDTDLLVDGLRRHGYQTLRNRTTVVTTRAGRVAIGGIDDPHMPSTALPTPAAVSPAGEGGDTADASDARHAVLHLGLVHAPYLAALDVLVDAGHDLMLAGHTHGGQVRLPGIGALVANCDLPLRQARGLSTYRGVALHVSVGLGHSRYAPFRFACRPEATLLEVTAPGA